jgi:hypothetical protein
MATYKGIQGYSVQSLASDPSPAQSVEGQLWYNSASNVWKISTSGAGAWAASGTMNTPYVSGGVYIGTTTAGVYAGGIPGDVTTTQTYNGSIWAASPATLNTGRHYVTNTGLGTSTAGQVMGGEVPSGVSPTSVTDKSEQFDGSTWTEVNSLTSSRIAIIGAGTQAAGLAMTGGGGDVSGDGSVVVESWDGTSWTAGTSVNDARTYAMGGGTQTSALVAGGKYIHPNILDSAETWNGSTWTEVAVINTAREIGGRGVSSDSSGIIFGGSPPAPGYVAISEVWNGSTWTEVGDLANARAAIGSDGTATAAIAAAGAPYTGVTEAWNDPVYAVKTVTTS